ncbi:DJ-1/PfpI family protein [Corynebacterium uropygiale]|uniref:DJ-1/PfpI family protein n=1 Tax=Corynebacterium uropygiale TaxID=1775911 RepID=A0A9X1QTL9_9CORY|nr:DJ-1/PfpI family protein [Corynebacterium uropygiale]MCF4007304.1 DJ-1/PfpI family protein [Corynebacterium uropygiale]
MGADRLPRRVGVVLFEGFEPLDVFGPVEILGSLPDRYAVSFHASNPGAVASAVGVRVDAPEPLGREVDILLVPGGAGTRALVEDEEFLGRLAEWGRRTPMVVSVCTGSALLAAAGLLDGYRATSNKRAFGWASGFGEQVEWVHRARWVEDRDRWTSSGVAAGMDMTAALVRRLDGEQVADDVCRRIELTVQRDPTVDDFA